MSDPVIIPPTCNILCASEVPSISCLTSYMWEALETDFTVPGIGGTADIAVCNSDQYAVGACVWIYGAGVFEITAKPNSTSIRVLNNGAFGNAAPTSVIGQGNVFVHFPPPERVTAIVTVSDEDTNVVTVTIQMRDAMNASLAEQRMVEVWISDTAGGALGTACDGAVAATSGTIIASLTAKTHLMCLTDATGALVLTFTESGALVTYCNVNVGSKYIAGDQAMTWA